jgi:hypothetical protein
MALQAILSAVAMIHVGLAISASWAVWHDDTLGAGQRWMQALLAWLLPFAGPLIVLHLVAEHCPAAIPQCLKSWPLAILFQQMERPQRTTSDGRYAKDDGYVRPRSGTEGEAGCGADGAGGD